MQESGPEYGVHIRTTGTTMKQWVVYISFLQWMRHVTDKIGGSLYTRETWNNHSTRNKIQCDVLKLVYIITLIHRFRLTVLMISDFLSSSRLCSVCVGLCVYNFSCTSSHQNKWSRIEALYTALSPHLCNRNPVGSATLQPVLRLEVGVVGWIDHSSPFVTVSCWKARFYTPQ